MRSCLASNCPDAVYCPGGGNHCIHIAIQCMKDKIEQNQTYFMEDIEILQEGIQQYLREHPEIGLEL